MPRTLIFDLGNTLVPFSFQGLEPRLGGHREMALGWASAAECGQLSREELQARLCRVSGVAPADYDVWWNSIFEPRWLIPPEWLGAWRRQYRLGIMSDTNPAHFEFLDQWMDLSGRFDFQILSYAVGACKPAPEMFAAAEQQAGCAPESIYYTDDLPANTAAARARGWQAERFTSAAGLPTWLRAGLT